MVVPCVETHPFWCSFAAEMEEKAKPNMRFLRGKAMTIFANVSKYLKVTIFASKAAVSEKAQLVLT